MKIILLCLIAVCQTTSTKSQNFTIQPYLQNANPNSITIMWEFSEWDTSYVEWGTTNALGNMDTTTYETTLWPAYIFTSRLNSLQANTQYFYQVTTGGSSSAVFDFYTPANSSDEKSINIVAMSDIQTDGNNPTKFTEITNDGIIDYVQSNYGGNTNENLDMILIPGDLVNTGTNYYQWKDEFFAQSVPLFSHVPFYPVLGNHEINANLYFQYMDLPENGTPGYEEHWWYKDNSNVRIIGLNSNPGYRIQEQLDWLDSILTLTANDNTIDFVFAELHHPHKSELWIAGNTPYTGDVIELLENLKKWFKFKFEVIYFYNVYGPNQISTGSMATVIGIFENLYKKKKLLTVVKPGSQSRRFTHIDDTIKACYFVWKKNKCRHYIISNKESYTILEVAKLFKSKIKKLSPRRGERYKSALTDMNLSNKVHKKYGKIDLIDYITNFKNNN